MTRDRKYIHGPLGAALVLVLAAGCSSNTEKVGKGESSSSTPPPRAAAETAAPSGGALTSAQGLSWSVPAGFQKDAPANTMRIAQYRIPAGGGGAKDGELAVFFFGAGSGGGTQANLERWAGQFKQDDGSDPMKKAKTETFTSAGGLKITTIEVTGRYESSGMGGGPSYNEPGWMLYGAVVEGQGGPWFFKAVGPEGVIDKNRGALQGLYKGLRTASS